MIRREFAFLLDAWLWCEQHGIDNWRDRVKRKDWGTWILTVPEFKTRELKLTTNAKDKVSAL
ncbi:MAG: hypothetical protein EBR30_03020 [Cytophagia bacterium]|jgi:hypothetical protein|nr:hypothetical protein [Cytophagia bacterium]NBW34007.1 hypothetical protein [Cytophagia bacterium]